jgi:ABC-type xylose transport system permease subunit
MGSDEYVPPSNVVSRAGTGVVGGLAGGLLAGAVLQVGGGMRAVSDLVGSGAGSVTWMAVLVACAFAGGLYGALLGRWVTGMLVPAIGIGTVFGALCWVLLGLLAVPLRRGTHPFVIDDRAMLDLLGYVAFGVIVGVVYAVAGPRRRYRVPGRRSWAMVYAIPRPRRRHRS